MLHAQVTPRAPPNGSNYQTLPTASPNHESLYSNEMGRVGAKGQWERGEWV